MSTLLPLTAIHYHFSFSQPRKHHANTELMLWKWQYSPVHGLFTLHVSSAQFSLLAALPFPYPLFQLTKTMALTPLIVLVFHCLSEGCRFAVSHLNQPAIVRPILPTHQFTLIFQLISQMPILQFFKLNGLRELPYFFNGTLPQLTVHIIQSKRSAMGCERYFLVFFLFMWSLSETFYFRILALCTPKRLPIIPPFRDSFYWLTNHLTFHRADYCMLSLIACLFTLLLSSDKAIQPCFSVPFLYRCKCKLIVSNRFLTIGTAVLLNGYLVLVCFLLT